MIAVIFPITVAGAVSEYAPISRFTGSTGSQRRHPTGAGMMSKMRDRGQIGLTGQWGQLFEEFLADEEVAEYAGEDDDQGDLQDDADSGKVTAGFAERTGI